MKSKNITKSFKETQKFGEEIAQKLKNGGVLTLSGELGSGKTTITQGIAKALGVKGKIISPTFIIIRKYELKDRNFYHIDLYRIEKVEDVKGIGLEEILNDKSNITVIEWPEKIEKYLPKERINLYLKHIDRNQRLIESK